MDPKNASSAFNRKNKQVIVCTPQRLPDNLIVAAAEHARSVNPLNFAPVQQLSGVLRNFAPKKLELAVLTTKYWGVNGVKLSVGFLDNPNSTLRRLILEHLNAWSEFANVTFSATSHPSSADVRIDRRSGQDGGYWSYVGTDIQLIPKDQPTMNLEAFTEFVSDEEFRRVVRHEAGHTLGFPHEHMRRGLVARIDRQAAFKYYARTQGWSKQEVIQQVLTPLEDSSLLGTPKPDPYSIMCYQVPGEITIDGKPIIGGLDIDKDDQEFAARIYPKPRTGSSDADAETVNVETTSGVSACNMEVIKEYLLVQKEHASNFAKLLQISKVSEKRTDVARISPERSPGKIDMPETTRRTKTMVAWDTGLPYDSIYVDQNLKSDLNYSDGNKRNLEGPIEDRFFSDVHANADANDLVKTTTVGDLASRIYNNYIEDEYKL